LGLLDQVARLALWVSLDRRGLPVNLESLEQLEIPEKWDLLDNQDYLGLEGPLEVLEQQEKREILEWRDHRDRLDQLDRGVLLETLVCQLMKRCY